MIGDPTAGSHISGETDLRAGPARNTSTPLINPLIHCDVKLTATEQRVVELYNNGLRPRDIANRLGISINTVYKALSKYRRFSESQDGGDDEGGFPQQSYSYYAVVMPMPSSSLVYSFAASPPTPRTDGLEPLVKRLEYVLERLEKLLDGGQTAEGKAVEAPGPAEGAPDFIRRNAWVKLLRGRSPQ